MAQARSRISSAFRAWGLGVACTVYRFSRRQTQLKPKHFDLSLRLRSAETSKSSVQ